MKKTYLFLMFLAVSALGNVMAQTDMTSKIVNPGFEQNLDGWVNDGMQSQSNTAFKLKVGSRYCEKWTGKGGKVGNGSITQTLTNLPAGTYTIKAVAQNIQEDTPTTVQTGVYILGNSDKTTVNVAAEYSVTTTICDGKLMLGLQILGATGNYVTVDDFHLTQEVPTTETFNTMHDQMQKIVDEANKIDKHTGTPEQQELDEARAAVMALIAQNTTEGVTEAVLRLQAAIYDYSLSVASESESVNMTSAIVNPSFEVKGADGWINQGMVAQTNSSFTLKNGTTYMEAWTSKGNKIGNVTLSQRVPLPNGKYVMTVAAQNIQEGATTTNQPGACIFADEYQTAVGVRKTYTLEFYVIEGQANIGFMTRSAGGNWVAVDNFQITYQGRSTEMLLSALAARISKAEALQAQVMNDAVKAKLDAAITAAKAITDKTGLETAAIALREAMEQAEASVSAYAALKAAIDEIEPQYKAGANGADAFLAAINSAKACYANTANTDDKVLAEEKALRDALLIFRIANATGSIPVVTTSEFIARGATGALGRSTVKGTNIMEQGFCWSTEHNPTVTDNRTTFSYNKNGAMYLMQPLKPATVYYVRAYAITKDYAVGYGEERKVITLPMGNTTYTYNNGGSPEENERINNALIDCIYYYNNWSATTNFRISCSYGSGTPTADCSYGGSMRVGPNPSYQRTGTILHESNHGVGIGTSSRWSDKNLHDGAWKGYRANSLLQFLENDPSVNMAGDGMHMWPYGINGANEDTGSPLLYIGNVMLTQAMHEDGIVPPGHGGCKPAYVFEQEDDKKYYITSESATYGAGTAYLTEGSTGTLTWSTAEMGTMSDDSYAWYMTFDPARQLYRIRNAKSGNYFTYSGGSIKTVSKTTPTDTELFHLMVARTEKKIGSDANAMTKRAYWIMAGNDVFTPIALNATAGGKTTSPNFDISDAASSQRWFIISADELKKMEAGGVDESHKKLQRLIAGARRMAEVEHTESVEGATSALEEATESMANQEPDLKTASELKNAIDNMWAAITTFMAGVDVTDVNHPFDITFMVEDTTLTNPDVWGEAPVVNYECSEFFNKAFTMTQVLPSMPKGTYKGCVQAFQRPGSYTAVYEKYEAGSLRATTKFSCRTAKSIKTIMDDAQTTKIGKGSEVKVGDLYIPDNMQAASAYFDAGLYDNEHIFTAGARLVQDVTIKVYNTSIVSADWTIMRNLRLYFYGKNVTTDMVTGIEELNPETIHVSTGIYDLSGRKMNENATLKKGLYIINGKKVMK